MINPYLKLLAGIVIITAALCAGHAFLIKKHAIPLWRLYTFLGVATFITAAVLRWMQWHMADKVHIGFIAMISVKLGLAVILFPELLQNDPALSRPEILAFLVPYFLYLFIEIMIVVKWLNKN